MTLNLRDLAFLAAAGYTPTHAETIDWQARVIAAGGTASATTLQAMDTFCNAIDAQSGLRGAITRLNLFCGDQLAAALVPLYRAESAGATAKGNATDTNFNFVAGDYSASGGLTGNGSSKYLNTGLLPSQVGTGTSGHLSVSGVGYSTTTEALALGSYDGTEAGIDDLNMYVNLGGENIKATHRRGTFSFGAQASPRSSWAHLIGSATSSTSRVLYEAGSAINTQTGSVTATRSASRSYFIFALNNMGSPVAYTAARQRMYSIGSGLSAAQVAAFSSAVASFNTALAR